MSMPQDQNKAIREIVKEFFKPHEEELRNNPQKVFTESLMQELFNKLNSAPGNLLLIDEHQISKDELESIVIQKFMTAQMIDRLYQHFW